MEDTIHPAYLSQSYASDEIIVIRITVSVSHCYVTNHPKTQLFKTLITS